MNIVPHYGIIKEKKIKKRIKEGPFMCTESQLFIIESQIVEIYRSVFGSDIVEILLYGSYARGDYDSESDIDIAAIVHGERSTLQKKLKIVWDKAADIGFDNDVVVSLTVIPAQEYDEYKSRLPYYRNIAMEGKKIG